MRSIKPQGTKGEKFHKILSIITGVVIWVAVLFLPLFSRFYFSIENADLETSDYLLLALGTFLIFGYKSSGLVANAIGKAIIRIINKF